MTTTANLSEKVQKLLDASQALSVDERIDLALSIWESLPKAEIHGALSEDQKAELERRWQDHLAHPEQAIPWEEAMAKLKAMQDSL